MNAVARAAVARFVAAGWALAMFAFYGFSSAPFHLRAIRLNVLDATDLHRQWSFVAVGMAAGAVAAFALARRGQGVLVAASYRAFVLVSLGFLPLYQLISPPHAQFFAIVVIGALFAWSAWLFAHRSLNGREITALDDSSASRFGVVAAVALAGTNTYGIARLAIWKVLALDGGWDLMIHNSLHYNVVATGRAWTTGLLPRPVDHYGNHFAPIEHLSAIVYAFHEKPETLVALQAVMIGLSALPVFGIARRLTRSTTVGLFLSASYGFNACTVAPCWYDFHEAAFLVPTLLGLMWACVAEKKWLVVLFAVLALCSREDAGLWVALFGVVWWSRGNRVGLRLAAAGSVTLLLVNFVVMPFIRSTTGQPVWLTDRYSALARGGQVGLSRTIESVVTNPGFVVQYVISSPDKWLFLAQILVPLALLPLTTRRGIMLIGPPIAFSVLSTFPPMYSIHFHYTVQILPFLYVATVLALERLERRTAIVLAATVLVTTSLVSGRFSRHPVLNEPSVTLEQALIGGEYDERAAQYRRMAYDVPHDGCAMGSWRIITPLSSRRFAYRFPEGDDCTYAFLEFGERARERDEVITLGVRRWLVERLRSRTYGVMFDDDRVALVGKGRPTERNDEVVRRIEALERQPADEPSLRAP